MDSTPKSSGKKAEPNPVPKVAIEYPERDVVAGFADFRLSDDGTHYMVQTPFGSDRLGVCSGEDDITPELVIELIENERVRLVHYPGPFAEDDKYLPLGFSRPQMMQLLLGLLEERVTTLLRERVPSFGGRLFLCLEPEDGTTVALEPDQERADPIPFVSLPFAVKPSEDDSHVVAGTRATGFNRVAVAGHEGGLARETVDELLLAEFARARLYPGPFHDDDNIAFLSLGMYKRLAVVFNHLLSERITEQLRERVPGFTGRLFFSFR